MDFEWTYKTCYHALCRYAEVAEKQQISVNTVDTQVRRATAKLRKALCSPDANRPPRKNL
jgi:DNA-directed RNA polymerase specialized sigma24 family protein